MDPRRPGLLTRGTSGLLGLLRDRGLPFLRGADDVALRTLALGLRAATVRVVTGPPKAPPSTDQEAPAFAALDEGDRFRLLEDNVEAFLAKCEAVEAARESVDCALFYLADDETGARFADALLRAVARGVRVRIGADTFATVEKQYGPAGYDSPPTHGALVLLDRLRRGGCETFLLGGDRFCQHRKFLFVDRTRLVIGGRNVADHYARPGWRDLEVMFTGPFAEAFTGVVESTFAGAGAETAFVPGIVAGVPGQSGRAFVHAVRSVVDGARETVDIEHAYLLSHPWLASAVRAAVARGVRVRAFTNSAATNDLPFMNWRLATSVRELLDAGAQVSRRGAPASTLHTKLVVGDRRRVVFGSTNLDYYSPVYCAELDIAVESVALAEAMTAFFEAGLAAPTTEAVVPGSAAAAALEAERNPWSVSRVCDLILHDIQ